VRPRPPPRQRCAKSRPTCDGPWCICGRLRLRACSGAHAQRQVQGRCRCPLFPPAAWPVRARVLRPKHPRRAQERSHARGYLCRRVPRLRTCTALAAAATPLTRRALAVATVPAAARSTQGWRGRATATATATATTSTGSGSALGTNTEPALAGAAPSLTPQPATAAALHASARLTARAPSCPLRRRRQAGIIPLQRQ
jgi:hypothetical protein